MDDRLSESYGIDRRSFLCASAAGAATLALGLWRLHPAPALAAPPATSLASLSYGDWRDVYRELWTWDRIVRSTHYVNCWYQAHCAWDVYVKDGVVWREEQAADYPQVDGAHTTSQPDTDHRTHRNMGSRNRQTST